MIAGMRAGRYLAGRFQGGRFSGRRAEGSWITAAVAPVMSGPEAGAPLAAAFPAFSLDAANYTVQGDPEDSIVDVIREWSLNGAAWASEDSPFTQAPAGFAFLTAPGGAFLTAPDGTYLVERAT